MQLFIIKRHENDGKVQVGEGFGYITGICDGDRRSLYLFAQDLKILRGGEGALVRSPPFATGDRNLFAQDLKILRGAVRWCAVEILRGGNSSILNKIV
jgi:hypothetical protein